MSNTLRGPPVPDWSSYSPLFQVGGTDTKLSEVPLCWTECKALWPCPRANSEHTIEVLRRLRAEFPNEAVIVLWDGAPYHRAQAVREAAAALNITLMPLPGYSPDAAAGLQP